MGRVKPGRTKRQRPQHDVQPMTEAYREALTFAFVGCEATWSHLAKIPGSESIAVVQQLHTERLAPCACRRLALDGEDLTRASLAGLATSTGLPYARAVLLAALDYAHRTGGCAAQGAGIHELVDAPRPDDEPAELSALLERLRLVHQAGTECKAVVDAFA